MMVRSKAAAIVACIPLVAALAFGSVAPQARAASHPRKARHARADASSAGRALFKQYGCGACHTLTDAGAAGKVGPSLDSTLKSKAEIAERIEDGKGAMPPFKTRMTAKEISTLASYVHSMGKKAPAKAK